MRYKVIEGPQKRAQRVLLYGPEGIGKSTMASQMPDPVFVDVEDGSGHLYVMRMPVPKDWNMLLDEAQAVVEEPGEIKTIVIDSADAAERLCQEHVCKKAKKPSIESWGYGKGYMIAAEEFRQLLLVLDRCISVGVNVVMCAHSQMRKFERPDESGAYDRFEVKLNKHIASMTKEWADAVLFLDYETFVSVDETGKGKASGGKRVIRCAHDVAWDAKNRWGLPDKLALDGDGIGAVRSNLSDDAAKPSNETGKGQGTHPNPELLSDVSRMAAEQKSANEKPGKGASRKAGNPKRLQPLFDKCQESDIRPDEVRAVMVAKGKREPDHAIADWEKPFVDWLVRQWPKVVELVEENRSKSKDSSSGTEIYDDEIPF